MLKYDKDTHSIATPHSTASIAPANVLHADGARTGFVAGVDIGGTNLRIALADRSGAVVARHASALGKDRTPATVVRHVSGILRDLLEEVHAEPRALRSIAFGAPAVTDVDQGVVIATSYLMGWRDVPLREIVARELDIPVMVDNDVNLAALGESWMGSAKDVRDFVFLAIGTGIGAGIVLNGKPHRGMHWAAGEVGYMLVPGVIGGPGEAFEPGALESLIGGEGIRTQWQNLCATQDPTLPADLNATQIFDRALAGDPHAQTLLEQSATMLAQAIYNMALVLNCPLFVLGGSVGMHPALRDAAQRVLSRWHLRGGIQLEHSKLGADAQWMGALRMAMTAADAR